jgi:hypothetical protein
VSVRRDLGWQESFIQEVLDSIIAFLQVVPSLVMVFNTIPNMIWI